MNNNFNYYTGVIGFPVLFVLLIWVVYWVEFKFDINLKIYGIQPNKFEGLRGVFFSPFLHSSLKHLFNNTIPTPILKGSFFSAIIKS